MIAVQIADRLVRPARIGDAEVGVGLQDDGFLRRPEVTDFSRPASHRRNPTGLLLWFTRANRMEPDPDKQGIILSKIGIADR